MNQAAQILLAEDDPVDRELELRALRKHNLDIVLEVVKDGSQAMDFIFCSGAYAERNILDTPRLIILDIKLPKVNGLEVLQAVRADPRTKFIPVVILTSSREEADVARSYDLGANSYVVKPLDYVRFVELVGQLGLYWLLSNQPPRASGK